MVQNINTFTIKLPKKILLISNFLVLYDVEQPHMLKAVYMGHFTGSKDIPVLIWNSFPLGDYTSAIVLLHCCIIQKYYKKIK